MRYNELKEILVVNSVIQQPVFFQSVGACLGMDLEKPEVKALRHFLRRQRAASTFDSQKDLTFPDFMEDLARHEPVLCDLIEDEAKAAFDDAKRYVNNPLEESATSKQHIFWNWMVQDIMHSKTKLSLWAEYLINYQKNHPLFWEQGEDPMERIVRHNTPEYQVKPAQLTDALLVDIYSPLSPKL